jgi:hypothetical protein
VSGSGCVNTDSTGSSESSGAQTSAVVSGSNKVMDLSGQTVIISGTNNIIKILNSDVEQITVSGTGNKISYPASANPKITDSGINTVITTY